MEKETLSFELYQPHHYAALKALMEICYSKSAEPYTQEELRLMSDLYPRGQIVCLLNGELIGANIARVVPYERYSKAHTQAQCIALDRYAPDTACGDSIYGLDVFVNPQYQNLKIGKQLFGRLVKHAFEDNFLCIIGISRVVNFPAYMHEMDCETYAHKVKAKELYDNALSFHLSNGAEFVAVSPGFSPDDTQSAGFGVILRIPNLDFDATKAIFPMRGRVLEGMRVS